MKTAVKIICIAAVVALMSPTTAVAMRSSPDAEFERAMKKGAQARLEIRVVDDEGEPVSNATVKVLFNILTPGGGEIVTVTTDTNGVAVAEGKTNDAIRYRVEKEGYYKSEEGMDMYNMSHRHEVKDGRWQPWGMQKEIVLRPVRRPQAIRVPCHDWLETKAINQWIGFDLEKYDFVAPVGKGEVKDFDLRFDWDGMYGSKHNGMSVTLRFNSDFSGGYYANKTTWSKFTGVYCAKTNAVYSREFRYERYPVRDAHGRIVGGVGEKFDQSKVLVVRSRCVLDDKGNLVSARYFQISGLEFSATPEGRAGICFNTIYNPTPNDPNLEPK